MPGFIELAVEKGRLVPEPVHGVRPEPPALVRRHRRCAGHDSVQIEMIAIMFGRLGRTEGALQAVGAPHGDGLVGDAVIQGARARQDVFDLHFIGNQPPEADLFARIGTAPVRRRLRQLLTQPHPLEIFADPAIAFGNQSFFQEFLAPALIGGAICSVAFDVLLFLLLRLLQIARQFQHDLMRPAMASDQRVDNPAPLLARVKRTQTFMAGFVEAFAERSGADGDFTLIVRLIGLAIALETAALVQVKQGAAEFVERDRLAQRPLADCDRVLVDHGATRPFIPRQQPVGDEQCQQMPAALDKPVAPPARTAGVPAFFCKRLPRSPFRRRLAAVGKNPHARSHQFNKRAVGR